MTPTPDRRTEMTATEEARLRIATMTADHYRDAEGWQRQQATGCGEVLLEVITALNVPSMDPARTYQPDDPILFGTWRASDVVAAARLAEEPHDA
jgi:hypothetical protein